MPIVHVPSDLDAALDGFVGPECHRRRQVLRETLQAFHGQEYPTKFHLLAAENLHRWSSLRPPAPVKSAAPKVTVVQSDWGDAVLAATQAHGACFAALNMANAFYPGGAYGEGAPAQEENMFRRTDCHFAVAGDELSDDGRTYQAWMTRLLSGTDGRVYLDTSHPRVCVRGPELRSEQDLGYKWLDSAEVFPFFELRASAQDLRDGTPFDRSNARLRIAAMLDTLRVLGVRHAVLSAFGCGAFGNPAAEVARLFREELLARLDSFDAVVFAIRDAGYGPDNYTPFVNALSNVA
jgi:hypothetical protein